jgi:hypothetical protein
MEARFMNISHPSKILISVETALMDWTGKGVFQEKLDGVFTVKNVSGGVIVGENVKGVFTAFDCVEANGEDVRGLPLARRLLLRDTLCRFHGINTVQQATDAGNRLLEAVLDRGGEGVCLKSPGSYFEPMLAAKRGGVWTCRVTGHVAGTQSVFIVDAETGEDRGKVTLRGGKCDQCRVDSLIRVAGMNLTSVGKIRQPQPAREWLVKL